MYDENHYIRKRILFFLVNIIVVFVLILQFLSKQLMPVIYEYGRYQCNSIITKIVNTVVMDEINEDIKEEIVIYENEGIVSLDFNTAILNSIASKSIKKMQGYLYKLEHGLLEKDFIEKVGINTSDDKLKRGIIYEVPFSRAFNNSVLGNLGAKIPVRYSLIGEVSGEIVSTLKEYGINNALLEINLQISSKSMVSIPILSEESTNQISIPLVIKIIQGDIPESFFGSNVIGGVN